MDLSNYLDNIYNYDLGLGIEPEIIDYIKESHVIQSRISPTRCYLLQQLEVGNTVGSQDAPLTITSYIETDPQYRAIIWSSGSNYPDLRFYTADTQKRFTLWIDGVEAHRVYEEDDIINDNEYALVKREDLSDKRVEVVFNKGFNASQHTITYTYSTIDKGINIERLKIGESIDSPHTLYGWKQWLDFRSDPLKEKHQVLVRTPLTTTALTINEEGKVVMEDNQCWMIWEPYVKDWDILIVPANQNPLNKELRYIIENKQDSIIQGHLVSQRFKIKLLEETDERYKIPYLTEFSGIMFKNAQLKVLKNVVEKSFTYRDFSAGSLLIGNISSSNFNILKVIISISTPFDSGNLFITDDTQTPLINDLSITVRNFYVFYIYVNYNTPVNLYLNFLGNPIIGEGKVIVYFV